MLSMDYIAFLFQKHFSPGHVCAFLSVVPKALKKTSAYSFLTEVAILDSWTTNAGLLALHSARTLFLAVIKREAHNAVKKDRKVWFPVETEYYTSFVYELLSITTYVFYDGFLIWQFNFGFSMLCVYLASRIQTSWGRLREIVEKHHAYLRLTYFLNSRYPKATSERLAAHDTPCSICWDTMEIKATTILLPCGHLFHTNCLRQWLTKSMTACPVCRRPLEIASANREDADADAGLWIGQRLLRFVIELGTPAPIPNEELQLMIDQVIDIFPDENATDVAADLNKTRSVELTSQNILEGRLQR